MRTKLLLASLFCFFFLNWIPVFSNISVSMEKTGREAPGYAANTPNSDLFLKDQVTRALANSQIKVEIKDGVATLSGKVPDEATKAAIAQRVANVPGVKSVDNHIEAGQ